MDHMNPGNPSPSTLIGARLCLRPWIDGDFASFADMNADSDVMEFFPTTMTVEQSRSAFDRVRRQIDERGWGLWAVEIQRELAGFCGLAEPGFDAPFTPCIEIGWRFHRRFWGRGYALEAARLALRFAFDHLRVSEVVSFTARQNLRSQRLMQRLGMRASPAGEFEHPKLPEGHPLRWHVLYRIQAAGNSLARPGEPV
jgi:ribosomal-protein-alanine N-acetyltransferase